MRRDGASQGRAVPSATSKKAPEPWRSQEPIVYLEVCDTGYRIGAVGTLAAGFEPAAGSDGVAVLGPG